MHLPQCRVAMHLPQCRSPQKLFFIQNALFQTVCKQLLFLLQGRRLLSPRCTYVFGLLNTGHYRQGNMLPSMPEDSVPTEAELPVQPPPPSGGLPRDSRKPWLPDTLPALQGAAGGSLAHPFSLLRPFH